MTQPQDAPKVTAVDFYWRPGCGFCTRLRRQLRQDGVPLHEVNIWEDPAAAQRVRQITGGDETVPTVVVGARAMVNPSIRLVRAALRAEAPDLLPATRASPAVPRPRDGGRPGRRR